MYPALSRFQEQRAYQTALVMELKVFAADLEDRRVVGDFQEVQGHHLMADQGDHPDFEVRPGHRACADRLE